MRTAIGIDLGGRFGPGFNDFPLRPSLEARGAAMAARGGNAAAQEILDQAG